MAYIIEKKIGSSIYLYEVTSYWDSHKKQSRQKRRYLGKRGGEISQKTKNENKSILSKDYGHIYLLQKLAEQCGLTEILQKSFAQDFSVLLALAIFEISEAEPLYLFHYWVESSFLKSVKALTSKELAAFTTKIGKMESFRLNFVKHWIKKQGKVKSIFFDLTSISNYAQNVEYTSFRYNRDDEKLPQINLGVVYAENTNMPIFYKIYPGSIKDVSTLHNILKDIDFFEIEDVLLILDRGFYSANNLNEMTKVPIGFIIPLPKSNNLFFDLIHSNKKKLSDYKNAFLFQEEVLFHTQESVEIKSNIFEAHIYLNKQQFTEHSLLFMKKLIELEKYALIENFKCKKEVIQYLKNASKFFQVSLHKNTLQLTRKTQVISEHVARFGVMIMLTNRLKLKPENILDLYRRKDHVEKIFDIFKNEFDGKRLRSHSIDPIDGRLFIKFIALILYAIIEKTIKKSELKQYSVREIIYELKKIKIVEINDGNLYLTEISKRQKNIFKAFNIEIPVIQA